MALDAVVSDALQNQITRERTNEAAYLAIGNRFDVLNLPGFAKWARSAAHEEAEHAQRFTDYLIDRGGVPIVAPLVGVNAPQADMLTAPAMLAGMALQVETSNTESIKTLYALADEADDPQTCVWLIWAIEEQTSAERELVELIARATFAQGCPAAILMLDKEMGA
jgi:ferritin